MKVQQRNLKKHLFICVNQRECGEDCHGKNALLLVKELKKRLKDDGLWDRVKVSKSGCLGGCAFGAVATLYPENKLITEIDLKDIDKLYDILIK